MERRCGLAASVLAWLLVASSALALDSGPEMHIAVSPDGKQVAANINGRADICLFDAATGRQHRTLLTGDPRERPLEFSQGGRDSVHRVAYSRDGRYLVAATIGEIVLLWDLQANDPPVELKLTQWSHCDDFVFSADDKSIIAFIQGSPNTRDYLVAWDLKTAKETWRRDLGMLPYLGCRLYPDGTALIEDRDGKISQESITGKKSDYQFRPDGRSFIYSQDGKVAALSVVDRYFPKRRTSVELKETKSDRSIIEITNEDWLHGVALSPDGSLLAIGVVEGDIHGDKYRIDIHTVKDGKRIVQLRPNNEVTALTFFPDNRRLIAGSGWSGVRIWDVSTGKPVVGLAYPDPLPPSGLFRDPPLPPATAPAPSK